MKHKWKDIVARAKKDLANRKHPKTGGGSKPKESIYTDIVLDIIGEDSPSLVGIVNVDEGESSIGLQQEEYQGESDIVPHSANADVHSQDQLSSQATIPAEVSQQIPQSTQIATPEEESRQNPESNPSRGQFHSQDTTLPSSPWGGGFTYMSSTGMCSSKHPPCYVPPAP